MLRELTVRRLAVIEDLHVVFGAGLNVLTGETGAGKSILVTAIGLALGWRATGEMIRTGCKSAEVDALFTGDGDKAQERLAVSRVIQEAGRNRVQINDRTVNVADLRELGEKLLNLYGQHEAQGLMRPEMHRDLLDAYAGLRGQRGEVAARHESVRDLRHRRADLERKEKDRDARSSYLRFVIAEIGAADPREGEDEELAAQRKVLLNAEALIRLAQEVSEILYDQDEGAVAETVGELLRRVEDKADLDERLAPIVAGLTELAAVAGDVAAQSRDYGESLEHDPTLLTKIEERYDALYELKNKYGGSLAAVRQTYADAERELVALEQLGDELTGITQQLRQAESGLAAAADKLSRARAKAAKKMEREVESELGELDMQGTRFVTPVEPLTAGGIELNGKRIDETGADQIEFLISPNVGELPRSLARIASGGELSRIMLAIKRVLSRHFPVPTLIFDEIDAGVGGAQAERLGRKLQEVAREHQVLCITHLPQIAALADRHYLVSKRVEKGRTRTEVSLLSAQKRIEELARMLGGETVSAAARAAAEELLRHGAPR